MGFPPSATGFDAGSRVGGYVLEEQIGHGGMAVVFRALDEKLGRRVALKVLAPALAADAAFRQRFIRESRAAAAIDDPHIIPLFEAGESDGVLFIAMRYVQGGDVRSLLAREGALDVNRVAAIVAPMASALDAAHAAGLVHRDVKPANMLLDVRPGRPDHVYLSDFGLSKEAAGSVGLTGTGLFLGTVDYASPEQAEGRPVDGRTDQYALACAAFEMLCGQPPFRRDQGLAVLHAHIYTPPPLPSVMRAGLPPAVDAVLGRALAKSPEDRYATCGEFSDALRGALGLAPYDSGSRPAPAGHPQTELAVVGTELVAGAGLAAGTADMDRTTDAPLLVPGAIPGATAPGPPTWQAPPGWVPVPSAWAPGPPGRRPAAQWPFLLMIGVVMVAAAVVAIVLETRSGGGAPIAVQGSTSTSGSTTVTVTPTRSLSPTVSPTPSPTPSPGWTTYSDISGFSIGLPPGWAMDLADRAGAYPKVDFAGPAPGFHLFVSWSIKTGGRALPAWQQEAASYARNDPGYHLVQLGPYSYRGYDSAVFEFTDFREGVLTHVFDLGFVIKPYVQGYAIELYGPQSQWSEVYGSMWNQVLATFTPAP